MTSSPEKTITPPDAEPTADEPESVDWLQQEGVGPAEAPETDTPELTRTPIGVYRETTRGQLARWLMGLLTVTVLTLVMLAALQMAGIIGISEVSVPDLAQIILGPVVTLTGTALGFYYGAHASEGAIRGSMPSRRRPGLIRRAFRYLW